ncbi:MAG: hypothetical protein MPW15_23485 [Candidatus Manganitrophus sp.]|nr:hypothetical protein [Candidatus Manganitrophus sp.]
MTTRVKSAQPLPKLTVALNSPLPFVRPEAADGGGAALRSPYSWIRRCSERARNLPLHPAARRVTLRGALVSKRFGKATSI